MGLTAPAVVQHQLSQMQQQTLAMQVAQMRAAAKINPGQAAAPGTATSANRA